MERRKARPKPSLLCPRSRHGCALQYLVVAGVVGHPPPCFILDALSPCVMCFVVPRAPSPVWPSPFMSRGRFAWLEIRSVQKFGGGINVHLVRLVAACRARRRCKTRGGGREAGEEKGGRSHVCCCGCEVLIVTHSVSVCGTVFGSNCVRAVSTDELRFFLLDAHSPQPPSCGVICLKYNPNPNSCRTIQQTCIGISLKLIPGPNLV